MVLTPNTAVGMVTADLWQTVDEVLIINSFSKYFSMTGWRLGFAGYPRELVEP